MKGAKRKDDRSKEKRTWHDRWDGKWLRTGENKRGVERRERKGEEVKGMKRKKKDKIGENRRGREEWPIIMKATKKQRNRTRMQKYYRKILTACTIGTTNGWWNKTVTHYFTHLYKLLCGHPRSKEGPPAWHQSGTLCPCPCWPKKMNVEKRRDVS